MAKLSDLFIDDTTDKLSHTKIWSHIAYATVSYKFIVTEQPVEIWFIYLGIVGSHNVLSKWISAKYGQVDNGTQGKAGVGNTMGVDGAVDISVK